MPPPLTYKASLPEQEYVACLNASQLQDSLPNGPLPDGWRYGADDRQHRKFGFISETAGSPLQLRVKLPRSGKYDILVGYLRSYERMGTANISCVHGCTCTPLIANGTHEGRNSLTKYTAMAVTAHNPDQCAVAFARMAPEKGPIGKFKVMSIVVLRNWVAEATKDAFAG